MSNNISFIVVRHGESEANSKGIISDREIDHQLTKVGEDQAQRTAELLNSQRFDLIATSTRQRARLTAEIINKYHNVDILEFDNLIERDFGVIGGLSRTEAQNKMEKENFDWVDIPESEKPEDIDFRVSIFLKYLVGEHDNSTILVCTHEDIVKSFHRVFNKVSIEESMLIEVKNSDPHFFTF